MLITIGITCFNAEDKIEKVIKNAIQQTWTKKEIIIIDDCSTDDSIKAINKFKSRNNIQIFKNKRNKGISFCRNKIVNQAKGRIIFFMDDDDISDLQRIDLQIKEIINSGYPNEKYIACTASMEREYRSGHKRTLIAMGSKGRLPKDDELANFLLFYEKKKGVDYGFGLPTCSMAITKECFEKVGLFDESLERVEDMDFSIRLSLNGIIFTSVKNILIHQESSSSNNKNYKNFLSEVKLIKKYSTYLKQNKLLWHALQWPYLRYYYFSKKFIRAFVVIVLLFIGNPRRTFIHIYKTGKSRLILDLKIFFKNFSR
ncbi:glycosyltransferase family 2 protein [Prochlorococcus marinus]|uniref:Putative glycosyl transferase n=1 Tax=Prochlorococcus marinus (strain AS9601) TaxID=146891 RepID=A2BSB8_PROMS|nr:glycosyltransferase family 2 protein [Prochlorococcus marinus]ABM70679.1 putative glycosyl transferase [Prochlorococcus marinus str. AS9601]